MEHFQFRIEKERAILFVTMEGFWSQSDLQEFETQLKHNISRFAYQDCVIVTDASRLLPQPGVLIEMHGRLMRRLADNGVCGIIFVGVSALLKMQARRAAREAGMAIEFTDSIDEAGIRAEDYLTRQAGRHHAFGASTS